MKFQAVKVSINGEDISYKILNSNQKLIGLSKNHKTCKKIEIDLSDLGPEYNESIEKFRKEMDKIGIVLEDINKNKNGL